MQMSRVTPELPSLSKRNHALTRFVLSQLERRLDVHIRLHGLHEQFAGGGGIVTANHFTRLETFVIPFVLHRELGLTVRILASPALFTKKVLGDYLLSIGALPTNYPNKYELIARDILHGGWWLIFPEGSMVKDRKVIERGRLLVNSAAGTFQRRPHSGAAIIALTVQRYKDALCRALYNGGDLEAICQTLGCSDMPLAVLQAVAHHPTRIVPLNVTYYPLNPRDNLLKALITRFVPSLVQSNMGEHILEELMVEGSMLLKGVHIDVRLGLPVIIETGIRQSADWRLEPWSHSRWRRGLELLRAWRQAWRFAFILDCWAAFHGRRQRRHAWQLTRTYMRAVYALTTVNSDHLLSVLLLLSLKKSQRSLFPVTEVKHRLYLALQHLRPQKTVHLHPELEDFELQHRLLTDQVHPWIDSFEQRATMNGLLTCRDDAWVLAVARLISHWHFGAVRLQNFMQVCFNEVEPLTEVMQALQDALRANLARQQARLGDDMFAYEQQLYEKDYAMLATRDVAKISPIQPDIGRPVLLRGSAEAGSTGILLIHGYSASPGEMLPLARYLHSRGLTVYVVRLRGHGTSPYDLQQRDWQEWYASVLRGYNSLRAISDSQFVGGMSVGGALALYLAAQCVGPLRGVFAVGAPITLHNRFLRLAPMAQIVRAFVRAEPENAATNYVNHPLRAIRQLTRFIATYQEVLPQVTLPVLLIQARGDTTVRPESAQYIYERIQSPHKRLLWKDIDHHVIVTAKHTEVHNDIFTFLQQYCSGVVQEDR